MQNIISFIQDNGEEYHKSLPYIEEYISQHLKYGTCTILKDDKGITAISRWNITGDTAHILDVIIRKDIRGKGILKELVSFGSKAFPKAKYIEFERETRKDSRMRKYSIKRLLSE